MLYQEDPERESTSNPDEVEQVVTDPYETAFMELRILRLSSRRLFNAVLKLSRSEVCAPVDGRPRHAQEKLTRFTAAWPKNPERRPR